MNDEALSESKSEDTNQERLSLVRLIRLHGYDASEEVH